MIEIVPYKEEHLALLEFPIEEQKIKDTAFSLLRVNAKRGPAYTGFKNGKVLGIAGVIILWKGVGEAWTIISPEAKKYKISLHKVIKTNLDRIIKEHNLHRVQTYVKIDWHSSQKWMEMLGFECEAILEIFGPNKEDYYLFARLNL